MSTLPRMRQQVFCCGSEVTQLNASLAAPRGLVEAANITLSGMQTSVLEGI